VASRSEIHPTPYKAFGKKDGEFISCAIEYVRPSQFFLAASAVFIALLSALSALGLGLDKKDVSK